MKYLCSTIMLPVFALALALGTSHGASANPAIAPAVAETLGDIQTLDKFGAEIVKVAHKRQRRGKRAQRNARPHKRFHQRYRQKQKGYKRAHRKFHRHYGQRHRNPGVTIRVYPRYDPYYYNPYYNDPYYYPAPRARLSCAQVRQVLHNHGYRKIRAYDCKGKVYNFYARYKGRRYKLRVSAYTGQVRSRVPY